jgi:hypothetical protein
VKLFVDQAESDGVLDDLATLIGCTRSNLHVVASDKGLVVGRVQFYEDGDLIDCTKMGKKSFRVIFPALPGIICGSRRIFVVSHCFPFYSQVSEAKRFLLLLTRLKILNPMVRQNYE